MGIQYDKWNNQKIRVADEVHYTLAWAYGCDLCDIENDIKTLKELGCNYIDIDVSYSFDSGSVKIVPYIVREETDEEYALREEKFRLRNLSQREKDLIQLKKLKEMYEQ